MADYTNNEAYLHYDHRLFVTTKFCQIIPTYSRAVETTGIFHDWICYFVISTNVADKVFRIHQDSNPNMDRNREKQDKEVRLTNVYSLQISTDPNNYYREKKVINYYHSFT